MNFPFTSFFKELFSPTSITSDRSANVRENNVECNHSSVKCRSPNYFMPTPVPPSSLFASKKCSFSERRLPTPGGVRSQYINRFSQNPVMLPTPMILSSFDSLCSGPTVGDAFPDILQLVDQESSSHSIYNFESAVTDIDFLATPDLVPKNDSEFVDLLITVADEIESEKCRPRSFTYTRLEDELQSRKSGQPKCRHAKRMTDEEENYVRRRRHENKENRRRKSKRKDMPRQGTRRVCL